MMSIAYLSSFRPQVTNFSHRVFQEILDDGNETVVIKFIKEQNIDVRSTIVKLELKDIGLDEEIDGQLIHYFAARGWREGLNLLMQRGAEADAKTSMGLTPLLIAAIMNKPQIAGVLIDQGANPDQSLPNFLSKPIKDQLSDNFSNPIQLKNTTYQLKNIIPLFYESSLKYFMIFKFRNSPEWQPILLNPKIKFTLPMLRLCVDTKCEKIFCAHLKDVKKNINEGEHLSLIYRVVANLEKPGIDILLRACLNHPYADLKHLTWFGHTLYHRIAHMDPRALQSKSAKEILAKTQGFGEIIALQTLLLNRFNTFIAAKINSQRVSFRVGLVMLSFQEIAKSFDLFLFHNKEISQDLKAQLRKIDWPLDNDIKDSNEILSAVKGGKIKVLQTGWNSPNGNFGHAVAAVLCKNQNKIMLMLCNRGEGVDANNSGIEIYEFEDNSNDLEFLSKIIHTLILKSESTKKLLLSIQNSTGVKKVAILKHKMQDELNCAWKSPKTSVRASIVASYLSSGVNLMTAVKLSKPLYKEWALFDRMDYGWDPYLAQISLNKVHRDSAGIYVTRTIQECLLNAPSQIRKTLFEKIVSRLNSLGLENILDPLSCAIFNENEKAALALVDSRTPLLKPSESAYSPIHLAAAFGFQSIVESLLGKGYKFDQTDNLIPSPANLAMQRGHWDIASQLINSIEDVNLEDLHGRTLLSYACEHKKLALVEKLLLLGADIYKADDNGHLPCSHDSSGNTILDEAIEKGNESLTNLLIDKGVKLHIRNDECNSELSRAILNESSERTILRLMNLVNPKSVNGKKILENALEAADFMNNHHLMPKIQEKLNS